MTYGPHWKKGLVARGTNLMTEGLQLSVPPQPPWRKCLEIESIANHQWFNQSWLCNEPSMKPQMDSLKRLVNTWRFGECGAHGENMEALCPFPTPCSTHLFYLAVLQLYSFIISWWSSKMLLCILWDDLVNYSNPRRGLWESLIYRQLVRSTGNDLCLWLVSAVCRRWQSGRLNP